MDEAGAGEAVDGIVATFVATAPQRLDALVAAAQGTDADQIQRAAHAFKSAAATLGAHSLATLLQEMEAAGQDGDVAGARTRLDRVREAARAAVDYLRSATKGGEDG
jgi:HPt (histidine-containing phosphotransfer) domain-containing protein